MSLLLQRCTSDCRSKPLARSKRSTIGIPFLGVTCQTTSSTSLSFSSGSDSILIPLVAVSHQPRRKSQTSVAVIARAGSESTKCEAPDRSRFQLRLPSKSLRHRINAIIALSHVAPGAQVEDYPEISAQAALFASATECYRRNLRPRCANGFWQLRFRSDCAAGKNRRCRECANEKARQFASPHKDVSDCRLCL